jgi:hypothetical protein
MRVAKRLCFPVYQGKVEVKGAVEKNAAISALRRGNVSFTGMVD